MNRQRGSLAPPTSIPHPVRIPTALFTASSGSIRTGGLCPRRGSYFKSSEVGNSRSFAGRRRAPRTAICRAALGISGRRSSTFRRAAGEHRRNQHGRLSGGGETLLLHLRNGFSGCMEPRSGTFARVLPPCSEPGAETRPLVRVQPDRNRRKNSVSAFIRCIARQGSCLVSAISAGIEKTPLESWIARRLGTPLHELTREDIEYYQLKALQQTVTWARQHSSFYAQPFAGLRDDLPSSLDELASLPFTSSEDIARHTSGLLCVSQDEISRVVTMHTSGTSGAPKRGFITEADQESALECFAHGVAAMAAPGDRMLIALPGEREGSVGFQLAMGIARAGVLPIPHGLSTDPAQTLAHIEQEKATCIIGLPVQILALFSDDSACAVSVLRRLRFIVLCSDHVPESLVRRLRQRTGCEIFEP